MSHPDFPRKRLLVVAGPAFVALLATLIVIAVAGPAGAQDTSDAKPLLPDLTQDLPRQMSVVSARLAGRKVYRLAFRSATENHPNRFPAGGDLLLVGRRPDRATKTMTVDQYVDVFHPSTGAISQEVQRDVGTMLYVRAGDHQHWHVKGFQRFELRSASGARLVAPDRKTGFCVGNRYSTPAGQTTSKAGDEAVSRRGAPSTSARLTFRDLDEHCALSNPDRLSVVTGLSRDSGDDYKPKVEGQYIDITKVRSGDYLLVHRANSTRKIAETNYANNASSVLLRIRRSGAGKPTVRTIAKCLGKELCAAPTQ